MRISDWSSDVCSSVLGVMPALYRLLTGVEIQEFLLDLHLGLPLQDRPPRYAGFVAARNIMPKRDMSLPDVVDLYCHKALDPKSVGLGLSVSVRVALGGRSIF